MPSLSQRAASELLGSAFLLSAVAFAAAPASAQLSADAQRAYAEFQTLAPHRAFAVAADGTAEVWPVDARGRSG